MKKTLKFLVPLALGLLIIASIIWYLFIYDRDFTRDTLLQQADVISLHCPLFPETKEIINAESIAKMKDGVILINTARGALLDEQAVADALASGKIRGAAVDVTTVEPIRKENPLLTAPNCLITPHMAWTPLEARTRLLNTVRDYIRGFVEGNPIHVVNP